MAKSIKRFLMKRALEAALIEAAKNKKLRKMFTTFILRGPDAYKNATDRINRTRSRLKERMGDFDFFDDFPSGFESITKHFDFDKEFMKTQDFEVEDGKDYIKFHFLLPKVSKNRISAKIKGEGQEKRLVVEVHSVESEDGSDVKYHPFELQEASYEIDLSKYTSPDTKLEDISTKLDMGVLTIGFSKKESSNSMNIDIN